MIKHKTAIQVYLEFVESNGRQPTKEEFIEIGYCEMTYYRTRKIYKEMLQEEQR